MGKRADTLYLVIDQGGHASRTVVLSGHGVLMAQAERPIETLHSEGGFVEHDPEQVVLSVKESIRDAVRQLGGGIDSVASAGLVTQRSNIACWNCLTGEALSPVISWQDTRGSARMESLRRHSRRIHETTGLFPSAHYGATKFRWCLDNIIGVREAQEKRVLCLGPMSSYLVWRLTEEKSFASDPVSASRTLLWNLRSGEWDPWLLDLFGVPSAALPECVATRHVYGNIRVAGKPLPLTIVSGDQSAALFSHGKLESDIVYINIGTGAFVSRFTGSTPAFNPRLLTSVLHRENSEILYALEGTVNGAGSALSWAEESLEIEGLWSSIAAWLNVSKNTPLFLNGVSGLAAPYWVPEFRSEFVGSGGKKEKVAAVVESIVFLVYGNIVEMNRTLPKPARIHVTGGVSRLDALCQFLADLSGLPLYRPAQIEATARGTGFLMAGMPGHWPEVDKGSLFHPGDARDIRSRFRRWSRLMRDRLSAAGRTKAQFPAGG